MTDNATSYGEIDVSSHAIATIASQAILRTYGVVGMAARNVVDGIANALTNDLHKGIVVTRISDEAVSLDVFVIMEYGTNLASVARSIANAVRYNIEQATGLQVRSVNVHVQGIRIDEAD